MTLTGLSVTNRDLFTCPACDARYQVGALGVNTGWFGCDRCRTRWNATRIVLANGDEYDWA